MSGKNSRSGFCCFLFVMDQYRERSFNLEVVLQQCRHLLDEQKCKDTEFRYGPITGKYVIYRGVTTSLAGAGIDTAEDVVYLNVEEYLKEL